MKKLIALCLLIPSLVFAGNYSGKATGTQLDRSVNTPYDLMIDFGAKCDMKYLSDGVTNTTTTFTSASANFTSSDVGKTIFIFGGGTQITAPTAPTVTPTGTDNGVTYTYKITALVPGFGETTASSTTSTVHGPTTLSSTNYITVSWSAVTGATSYNIYRTAGGITQGLINYFGNNGVTIPGSSVITTSLVDTGLSAAGSSPVSNTAYTALSTSIASVTNSTTVVLSVAAGNSGGSKVWNYGTDDSTAFSSALTTIEALGSGTITLPGTCLINSQITFPNSGDSTNPVQANIRITGNRPSGRSGFWLSVPVNGVSGLDLRNTTAPGSLVSLGGGSLEIDHIQIINGGYGSNTFLFSTNTTPYYHDNLFKGSGVGANAINTAIILGGASISSSGNTVNNFFQGYIARIEGNFFDQIKTAVNLQWAANGSIIGSNTISESCGNLASAPFEINGGGATGAVYGCNFPFNFIELPYYKYSFNFITLGYENYIDGGQISDTIGNTVATINFNDTNSINNLMVGTMIPDAIPLFSGAGAGNGNRYNIPGRGLFPLKVNGVGSNITESNIEFPAAQTNPIFQVFDDSLNIYMSMSPTIDTIGGRGWLTLANPVDADSGSGLNLYAGNNNALIYLAPSIYTGTLYFNNFTAAGNQMRWWNSNNSIIGMQLDHNWHLQVLSGTPTISSCGTGAPSVSGSDQSGIITAGAGVLTACVVNFGHEYTAAPVCIVNALIGAAPVAVYATATTGAITVSGVSLTSGTINYHCF